MTTTLFFLSENKDYPCYQSLVGPLDTFRFTPTVRVSRILRSLAMAPAPCLW